MARKSKQPKIEGMTLAQEAEHYQKILPKRRHAPGIPNTLVIDGRNLAHMAYHSYSRLSYKGISVAMIFGVPQMIRSLINQYKPAKVVVCWDGMKSKRRMKWVPGYKQHRLKNRDEIKRAKFERELLSVRLLLYWLGIPQAHNVKVEGDDMIYLITQKESKLRPVTIVSGDKDMLQMVNWDVRVINPRTKSIHSADTFSLSAPYLRVDQIVDYISLVGDHSDDIPGIRGIGESKSIQFLRRFGSFKEYCLEEDVVWPGLMDKDKASKVMKLNRKMIDIAWYCGKYHKKSKWVTYFKDKSFPKFNEEKYAFFCRKYNLKTMLYDTFKKPFQQL